MTTGGIKTLLERNQQRTFSDARKTIVEFEHPAFSPVAKLLRKHADYEVGVEVVTLRALLDQAQQEARERDEAAVDYEVSSEATQVLAAAHKDWQARLERRLRYQAQRGVPGAAALASTFGATLRQRGDAIDKVIDTTVNFLRRLREAGAVGVPDTLLAAGDELVEDAVAARAAQDGSEIVHDVSAWELRPAFQALVAAMDAYQSARRVTADEHGSELPVFDLTASRGGGGEAAAATPDIVGFAGTGERGM